MDGEPRLSKTIETEVYRVTQEALNNILKHAQATLVVVKIRSDLNHFNITIQDNGKGFDPSALEKGGGLGFRNIRERIHGIGGAFRLDTAPGQGTSMYIEVKTTIENNPIFSHHLLRFNQQLLVSTLSRSLHC